MENVDVIILAESALYTARFLEEINDAPQHFRGGQLHLRIGRLARLIEQAELHVVIGDLYRDAFESGMAAALGD